jgi:hypothetical protein
MPDHGAMHTLITYAAPPGPHCRDALTRLQLPHLAQLIAALSPGHVLHGLATDLTPVHERALAQAAGLDGADGLIPWAALEAHQRGLTSLHSLQGWAWVTPCHWKVHADHVEMADPVHLALTSKDADALHQAMQPFFAEDAITLFAPGDGHVIAPTHTRWLAHGPVFTDLATASLDRVAGQSVDRWMPRQEQAKTVRRLQNEMQMFLYTHPVNDSRAKFHLAAVNAFWVSGTGTLADSTTSSESVSLRDALRASALQDDAAAWVTAWHALDSTTLAHDIQRLQQGEPVRVTLCSDTQALTLEPQRLGTWERLRRRVSPLEPRQLLSTLCTS